jgi:hypothetical protein
VVGPTPGRSSNRSYLPSVVWFSSCSSTAMGVCLLG